MLSLIGLVLFGRPYEVSAQKRFTYDSTYQALPNVFGGAKFQYYLDKKEYPVKDGDFQFNQAERDSLNKNNFVYQEWRGKFEEGKKVGVWEYLKHFHRVNIANADYGTAEYTVQSQRSEVSGAYRDGLPEGYWLYEKSNYEGEKMVNEPEVGEIDFYEGRANGTLQFLQKDVVSNDTVLFITGEAQKGLMEGSWQFLYQDAATETTINEQRYYKKGILLELRKVVAQDTITQLTFPLSPSLKASAEGEDYKNETVDRPLSLAFNDGYPRNSEWMLSQQNGNEILTFFLSNFSYYHPDVTAEKGLSVGTNRGFYPLKADEKKAAEDWLKQNILLRERLQILEAKGIEFYAYSQDSVLQWIQAWTDEQDSVLVYTAPWIQLIERNEIEFYYRKGVIVDYAQNVLAADTLNPSVGTNVVVYQKETKEKNGKSQPGFLGYIAQNFEERLQLADSLLLVFDRQVAALKVQKEILALETSIVKHKTEVDSLFEATPFIDSKKLEAIYERSKAVFLKTKVVALMDNFLSSYKSPARQRLLSDSVHIELKLLETIRGNVLELDANLPKIDSIYTEYKFDPFTFSDRVPFRAQKTLYKTAIESIIPYLFNEAENATQAYQMLQSLQRADALIDRMNLLREKNTKPLERKLKSIESPEEALETINRFLK